METALTQLGLGVYVLQGKYITGQSMVITAVVPFLVS